MLDFTMLIDLAAKLNVIQTVKEKLLRQPDPAADKLVIVLAELSKVYGAIDNELVRYLSLYFDTGQSLQDERAVLLTLEGGQLRMRVGEASGHCHKIWNIYSKYLERWFHDALSPDEASSMQQLFSSLSYADSQMLAALDDLTRWLSDESPQTLNLVDAGKLNEANARVRAARKEIMPARQAISKAMSDLMQLQADFIAVSQIV
jgi:DNA transposition AAA+ family ATPase